MRSLPSTQNNNSTVLFISKGAGSASTRYRCLDFFSRLEANGFTPRHLSASGSRLALLRKASAANTVVVLRKTFNAAFCHLLRRVSRRLVFDFDDAVFSTSCGHASRTRRKRFTRMVRLCDLVWAGNRFLLESACVINPAVSLVPTALDPARYRVAARKPVDTIDLVWIGSHSTSRYLASHLPVLEQMAAAVPNLRLKIVADFDLSSSRLKIISIPWSPQAEVDSLRSAHIGIAPMTDDTWTRGKCALKILQYMAAGLPVISSPVGANREAVMHKITGFLADRAEAWVAAAVALSGDERLRDTMGAAGYERVCRHYSHDTVFATMKRDLLKLSAG